MLNSHSIPQERWVDARKYLVFYFSRRRCANAEDLAQETLMTVWLREDYMFEKEEDFLRVCYGFARHILQQGNRTDQKYLANELTPVVEHPGPKVKGLREQEVQVFLSEVCRHAAEELMADELALIEEAINRDIHDPPASSRLRVILHRARKKLAKLTGWRQ